MRKRKALEDKAMLAIWEKGKVVRVSPDKVLPKNKLVALFSILPIILYQ